MNRPADNLRINGDRLWGTIHEIARIGPGVRGGSNRQTLTDADAEGRRLFQRWCEDAGKTVKVDRMGTMRGRREGNRPSLPPVVIGSHLDTQPTGGRAAMLILARRRSQGDPAIQTAIQPSEGELDQRGGDPLRAGHARLRASSPACIELDWA